MLEELRQKPTLKVLEDLCTCLAYRSTAWLSMYCRLGGVAMQLEVSLSQSLWSHHDNSSRA